VLRFAVRRLLLLVPILVGLSILVFAWVRALPGGPEAALLGERSTPERIAQVRHEYGLDKPLVEQYLSYVGKVAHGDFGSSIKTTRPVLDDIGLRFPATVELALAALLFAVAVGIPLGFVAARRYQSWVDNSSMVGSLVGISVPVFFLAYMLKYVFAVKLHWLPSTGRLDPVRELDHPTNFYVLDAILALDGAALWDAIRHLILPGIALGTIPLAIVTRITRAAVLEVTNEDYVRTAEAKGLRRRTIDGRHVLRNAMLPVATVIGLQTGLLLSGAVLTEIVFAWPGIGSWLYQAVFNRDFPVLEGGILFLAVVFVLVNLLVDLSYGLLDPRIRLQGRS
jgi:peptide/nickel transport system permease protein